MPRAWRNAHECHEMRRKSGNLAAVGQNSPFYRASAFQLPERSFKRQSTSKPLHNGPLPAPDINRMSTRALSQETVPIRSGASLLEIRNLQLEFGSPEKPLRA